MDELFISEDTCCRVTRQGLSARGDGTEFLKRNIHASPRFSPAVISEAAHPGRDGWLLMLMMLPTRACFTETRSDAAPQKLQPPSPCVTQKNTREKRWDEEGLWHRWDERQRGGTHTHTHTRGKEKEARKSRQTMKKPRDVDKRGEKRHERKEETRKC